MSPVMAAAAALAGRLADVRKLAHNNITPIKAAPKVDLIAEVAEPDTDSDIENVIDLPQDGEQTASSEAKSGPAISGGLPPFTILKGIAAPMDRSNVDTDAIVRFNSYMIIM